MRKTVIAAFAAAVLAAAPAAAGPPAFDKAEGAGKMGVTTCSLDICADYLLPRSFEFSAIQQGFGARANGFYHLESLITGLGRSGRVTCLNVLRNTAVFGGITTGGTPDNDPNTSLVGMPFAIWVIDNGPPGSALPDLISTWVFGPTEPQTALLAPTFPNICPQPFPSITGYFPVTDGDIVVDDESPGVSIR